MSWAFSADEHYYHGRICEYTGRPFSCTKEMNEELIKRHNEIVTPQDTTVHVGDFSFGSREETAAIIKRLNGNHIFLKGSHDRWMQKTYSNIWQKGIDGQHIVACHWAMLVWPRSHYGSWLVHGHSHGNLDPMGKMWDVGVDNNNFYPVSLGELRKIMKALPDNINLIREGKRIHEQTE